MFIGAYASIANPLGLPGGLPVEVPFGGGQPPGRRAVVLLTVPIAAVSLAVRFRRVDVLVNNAGNFYAGFFEEVSPQDFRAQVETTLFGPLNVTRAVLPVMRAQRAGLVVAISSTAGIVGHPRPCGHQQRGQPGNHHHPGRGQPGRQQPGGQERRPWRTETLPEPQGHGGDRVEERWGGWPRRPAGADRRPATAAACWRGAAW